MNYPKVTIGVPIYGVEKYIERCARSIFRQTYSNLEFVFCDDCTPDHSIKILEDVLSDYSENIKDNTKIIKHEKNRGLGAARNSIIDNATGDFIFWVDSDDYVEDDVIELTVVRQLSTNADIVNTNYQEEYDGYVKKRKHPAVTDCRDYTIRMVRREVPINIWGRLIRLSLYLENNLFVKEGVDMGEDYQISTRLAFYSHKIESIDRILYHFNCTNSTSYTKSGKRNNQGDESFDIVRTFFYDKGKDFIVAISVATLNRAVDSIFFYKGASWVVDSNLCKVFNVERKYWKEIVWYKRIILCLIRYPVLLNIYISVSDKIKKFVLSAKCKESTQ